MKKCILLILCLLSFSSVSFAESLAMKSDNDLSVPNNMKKACMKSFSESNFMGLEKLLNEFKKPEQISYEGKSYTYYQYDLDVNGDYKIEPCYTGVISSFNSPAMSDEELNKSHLLLLNYLKSYPKSDSAISFNSIFELSLALKIKPNDTQPLTNSQKLNYNNYLKIASNLLDSSAELFHVPIWYKTKIEIEVAKDDKNEAQLDKYLNQSIKLYPDYLPSFLAYTKPFFPENGGSWMLVNNVAQKAMIANQTKYNNEFYSRFYAGIAKSYKFSGLVYNQSLFDESASEFLTQFNTDYNFNRLAHAACTLNSPRLFVAFASKMTTMNQDVWDDSNFYNQCMSGVKVKALNQPIPTTNSIIK